MISDHKNLFYQGKRLIYAILPYKPANTLRNVLRESGRIFTSFIFGKALDSLIIGIICFIAMVIFRFPYAVLISVVVGITNMIPYFGPYIGGAVGFLFILIVSPFKALLFALLILVIQQFDGLYLGPKILGDKTGLKPLWVIFSIQLVAAFSVFLECSSEFLVLLYSDIYSIRLLHISLGKRILQLPLMIPMTAYSF